MPAVCSAACRGQWVGPYPASTVFLPRVPAVCIGPIHLPNAGMTLWPTRASHRLERTGQGTFGARCHSCRPCLCRPPFPSSCVCNMLLLCRFEPRLCRGSAVAPGLGFSAKQEAAARSRGVEQISEFLVRTHHLCCLPLLGTTGLTKRAKFPQSGEHVPHIFPWLAKPFPLRELPC